MYLDFLNNPLDVDDLVIYPQSAGSSSARVQLGRVLLIDPMVRIQHPRGGGWSDPVLCWDSKRPKPGEWPSAIIRWPQKRVRTGPGRHEWEYIDDDERAYRLRIQKLDLIDGAYSEDGLPVWIVNVDRVTVVTGLLP